MSENRYLPPKIRKLVIADYKRAKQQYDLFLQVEPEQKNSIALRFSRGVKENIFSGKCDFRTYIFTTSALQGAIRDHNRR